MSTLVFFFVFAEGQHIIGERGTSVLCSFLICCNFVCTQWNVKEEGQELEEEKLLLFIASCSGTEGKMEAVTYNLFNSENAAHRGWVQNCRCLVLETLAERGMFLGLNKGGEHKDEWWKPSAMLRQGNSCIANFFTLTLLSVSQMKCMNCI